MILRVGLTGGTASGKSSVAAMFEELGCVVLDADQIVASLYRPGEPGHAALVAAYGPGILLGDGEVDRPKLASIAFSSETEAQRLNALIHPLVIERETALSRRVEGILVVEATLLLESGGKQRYDRIVVVDIDPATQLARAEARGMPREEAMRRIRHQMPREQRLRAADYIIDNNGSREETAEQVRRTHEKLRGDLAAKEKRAG